MEAMRLRRYPQVTVEGPGRLSLSECSGLNQVVQGSRDVHDVNGSDLCLTVVELPPIGQTAHHRKNDKPARESIHERTSHVVREFIFVTSQQVERQWDRGTLPLRKFRPRSCSCRTQRWSSKTCSDERRGWISKLRSLG